jgi:glycosyltransferase involved in cell wall biosynthesis
MTLPEPPYPAPGWFTVILPTYQRSKTLPKAIDSLLEQTYPRWLCRIMDDGSTDETEAILESYLDSEPRLSYVRYDTNRGGVAMNERGMEYACHMTEYWTRLGSDDWFLPRKLELDAEALSDPKMDCCWGPYTMLLEPQGKMVRGDFSRASRVNVSSTLLDGGFMASWANIAVKTAALKRVYDRYGNFCDPRLHNAEDFLVNARLAKLGCKWKFRGNIEEPDAVWRNMIGTGDAVSASANELQTERDTALTRKLIREMDREP